jgi:hypothetical protein
MMGSLRVVMLAVAAGQALLALAMVLRPPILLEIWPFPDTTELTFIFLASIFAAAAASTAWSCLWGERGSLAGVALDYVAIFWPMTGFLLLIEPARGGGPTTFMALLVATAAFGAWLLWRTVGLPYRDPRPTPSIVLWSFRFFVVALVIAGGALVVGVPNILPWRVTRELSVVAGLIFLGAATYFAYAAVRPAWVNAGGQLAGFLAYDLVLIVPFLVRLPTIPPEWLVSLVVYTAVVTYSGLLAGWYLFVSQGTRIGRPRAAADWSSEPAGNA